MLKKILVSFIGLVLGVGIGYIFVLRPNFLTFSNKQTFQFDKEPPTIPSKQIIGYQPYWLLSKQKADYSPYLTRLAYFALTLDSDGSIKKLDTPLEEEPGWFTLTSGKYDEVIRIARGKNLSLSLVVFSGDSDSIEQMIGDPVVSAGNLIKSTIPLMKRYGFSDLNIDIEDTQDASNEARTNFTRFLREVKNGLSEAKAGTLTIDISGADLIKQQLINPKDAGEIADYVVVMTYDYHYPGSVVTGAVAPLSGAGVTLEYDVESAIQKAVAVIPKEKVILGIPLYGYEWETIAQQVRSAVVPGTGITASNQRVEKLLSECSTCSAQFDEVAKESYLSYLDTSTDTYHQIYFPTKMSTQVKVDYANNQALQGVAFWALGYEGTSILDPLIEYKKEVLESK